MRKIISRANPNQLPDYSMPLYVRSVGYNEADAGWSEFMPAEDKNFVQIFWSVKGSGGFKFENKIITMPENSFMYHLPGEDHHHMALTDWAYHWFTLDGPLASEFILGYNYPRNAIQTGQCPCERFTMLEKLMREMTPFSQGKMLSIAIEILTLANSGNSATLCTHSSNIINKTLELIRSNYHDPCLNVNAIADQQGIHRTTLTRIFRKHLLKSPGEYLLDLRIQTALSLLRGTQIPVGSVGENVGIPHRAYFCRLIKCRTGVTPTEYRNNTLLV